MSQPSLDWFRTAGLGIFLHFGHAAARGWELSWQMTGGVEGQYPPRAPVPCEDYFANAETFDPRGFDAAQWAELIAGSGATYAVFTTKHHDGFSMFDTLLSDYSIARTAPFGRDLLAELTEALRARGIRIGFYFSLIDWHHEDYPRKSDMTVSKPYRLGDYPQTDPEQWSRYRTFMLGQLTELLTNYGRIDVLWFDGEFEHTAEEWDFGGIREHVRALQPGCLVNDRCVGHGDFRTPEQQLPSSVPDGPWEMCLTMNDSWGWTSDDGRWKSTPAIITHFVNTVTTGGNLLLNVGPQGDGAFPPQAKERLAELGTWIDQNREAVFDLDPGPDGVVSAVPTASRTAADRTHVYAYCTLRPWDRLSLQGIQVRRVRSARVLGTGEQLDFVAIPYLSEVHSGTPDPLGVVEISLPDSVADSMVPVIELLLSRS